MTSFCAIISAFFLIAAPIGQIYATPNGAPIAACSSMVPQHGVASQPLTTSPFITHLPNGFFSLMGSSIRIELRPTTEENTAMFKGYLVMAFQSGTDQPIGTFDLNSNGKMIDCSGGVMNAATHMSNSPKRLVSMNWNPPAGFMGDVVFRTTFVQDKSTFWVKTETKPITIGHTSEPETTPAPKPSTTTTTSTTSTTSTPDVTTPKSTASQMQSTWASLIIISLVTFLMRS